MINDHQMKNIHIEYGHITKSILIVIVSMTIRKIPGPTWGRPRQRRSSSSSTVPPSPKTPAFLLLLISLESSVFIFFLHLQLLHPFQNTQAYHLSLTLQLIFQFSSYLLLLSSYECESNIWESVPTEKITFCSIGKVVNRNNPAKSCVYLLLFQFCCSMCVWMCFLNSSI